MTGRGLDVFGLHWPATDPGRRAWNAEPQSVATIDLDVYNPDEFPAALDRHRITGYDVTPDPRAWCYTWRFTGRVDDLARFLIDQYDDGSGEHPFDVIGRHLYPEGVTA